MAAANKHVPDIDMRISVVKEYFRATCPTPPFQRIPKLLTTHMVSNTVKMLNFFPKKGGISDSLRPKTIMSGETLDFKKYLCLYMGQYCQANEEERPHNIKAPISKQAICLVPIGNIQGGYKFMA